MSMVRQAHQPWFDKLTNRGSTSSPTAISAVQVQHNTEKISATREYL
ncbi:hypothetical protein [Actinobacillus porcinus]|nr:hypothetical protein [Actinobacillus porcinus]MDD7546140.1 hypothetical protein [Actinobacillus porcinus]MDY5847225.1 hypothetical protein [Actinobacillus porcinus]